MNDFSGVKDPVVVGVPAYRNVLSWIFGDGNVRPGGSGNAGRKESAGIVASAAIGVGRCLNEKRRAS